MYILENDAITLSSLLTVRKELQSVEGLKDKLDQLCSDFEKNFVSAASHPSQNNGFVKTVSMDLEEVSKQLQTVNEDRKSRLREAEL